MGLCGSIVQELRHAANAMTPVDEPKGPRGILRRQKRTLRNFPRLRNSHDEIAGLFLGLQSARRVLPSVAKGSTIVLPDWLVAVARV